MLSVPAEELLRYQREGLPLSSKYRFDGPPFAVILYYLTHGVRLLQGDYVRCCDRESEDGKLIGRATHNWEDQRRSESRSSV